MSTTRVIKAPTLEQAQSNSKLLDQYSSSPIHFAGSDSGLYERHLLFDNVNDMASTDARDRFEAFARSCRDVLSQRWTLTTNTYERENPKRVYYLPMEFLIGRSLANNVINLLLDPLVSEVVRQKNIKLIELLEQAQERLGELYVDPEGWARKAILNVAGSGKFSSNRTIAEYAVEIWRAPACPVS